MTPFSLLIPTFNRAALLRRLLSYYTAAQFPHPIIVADSSVDDIRDENRDTISRCAGLHITHRTYESSTETFHKITDALRSIESDAIGLCADDDFLCAEAPARALRLLAQNPEYASVQGRSFIADSTRGSLTLSAFPQRGVYAKSATLRLRLYFHNPTANFYAIHRTRVLKTAFTRLARFRTDNSRFEELAVSTLGAIEGDVAVLNALHYVRQSSKNRADSGSRLTGGWKHISESASFAKNREIFIQILAEALVERGIDKETAFECAAQCFDMYVQEKLDGNNVRDPRSMQERAIALMLLPAQGRMPAARRILAFLMRSYPPLRSIYREYSPIAQLISQYPDGISTRV